MKKIHYLFAALGLLFCLLKSDPTLARDKNTRYPLNGKWRVVQTLCNGSEKPADKMFIGMFFKFEDERFSSKSVWKQDLTSDDQMILKRFLEVRYPGGNKITFVHSRDQNQFFDTTYRLVDDRLTFYLTGDPTFCPGGEAATLIFQLNE